MRSTLIGAWLAALSATQGVAGEIVVTMAGSTYSPATITAAVGDSIRFVNDDAVDHNVFVATASHSMDLGKQEPGAEVVFVLRSAGAFEVECVFHDHMLLNVEILG